MKEQAETPFKGWKTYLEDSNYSEGTRELYVRHLQEFSNWLGVTPDELLDLQVQAVQSGDPTALAVIPRKVKEYIGHQVKNMGRHQNTADTTRKAVKNFFTSNHVPIEFLRTKKVKSRGVALIRREEALRLYNEVAPANRPPERFRALEAVLKDTGMRVEEVAGFTIEQFLDADVVHNEEGEEFRVFKDSYFIGKTGTWGWPHFGPESVSAVMKYIEDRKHGSLFLDRAGPIKGINITTIMRRACAKLKTGRRLSAHSFRKFFQTELERAGMDKNWIAKLQGREIGDSTASYSKPEEGQVNPMAYVAGGMTYLTQKYIECYDALRILKLKEDQRIDELEAQLERQHMEAEIYKWDRGWIKDTLIAILDDRVSDAHAMSEARRALFEGRFEEVPRILEARAAEARVEEMLNAKIARAEVLDAEAEALKAKIDEAETIEEEFSLREEVQAKLSESVSLKREALKAREAKIEELKRLKS